MGAALGGQSVGQGVGLGWLAAEDEDAIQIEKGQGVAGSPIVMAMGTNLIPLISCSGPRQTKPNLS